MVAIIDYHAGNLTSVRLALEAIGAQGTVTSDPAVIRSAERIIFPGVGAAGAAMENLRSLGLADVIRERVASGVPFLGICLGTQILFDSSEEDGGVPVLGIIPGTVKKFHPTNPREKVPEMGWNQVRLLRPHPVFDGIPDGTDFYFVHSYYPAPALAADAIGATTYGGIEFSSAVGRGNVVATQFHPEKSGKAGLRLLTNFLAWTPAQEAR